jgi:hypothetical protein
MLTPSKGRAMSEEIGPATVREFESVEDIWPVVDAWAGEYGYRTKELSETSRLYQRGAIYSWLAHPWKVRISRDATQVRVEAWLNLS